MTENCIIPDPDESSYEADEGDGIVMPRLNTTYIIICF